MKIRAFIGSLVASLELLGQSPTQPPGLSTTTEIPTALHQNLNLLRDKALQSNRAWNRLAYLCDTFGPRLSGSTNLEAALDWIIEECKKDGLDPVRGEKVQIPVWKRGPESLELVLPQKETLPMLSLGGSIPTPEAGLTANILVVTNAAELKARKAEAAGKIVLFNTVFTSYGETVEVRVRGAIEAAKAGAVASLVRSITPFSLRTPHTGMMVYEDGTPKIPHAAITSEDADRLAREQARGRTIQATLKISAKTLEPGWSRNVVADLRGSQFPDEVVIVSGHIDSWDVGQGAQDDGGGCISAWEVLRLAKELGLRPKRTLRLVLWVNEENGSAGAKAYPQEHLAELDKHVLAFESDEGTFEPDGLRFTGSRLGMEMMQRLLEIARPAGPKSVVPGSHAADISHLVPHGVPTLDLQVGRNRYFWFHHSAADTVDKVDPIHLNQCTAAIAVFAFGIADHPLRLPR